MVGTQQPLWPGLPQKTGQVDQPRIKESLSVTVVLGNLPPSGFQPTANKVTALIIDQYFRRRGQHDLAVVPALTSHTAQPTSYSQAVWVSLVKHSYAHHYYMFPPMSVFHFRPIPHFDRYTPLPAVYLSVDKLLPAAQPFMPALVVKAGIFKVIGIKWVWCRCLHFVAIMEGVI